MASFERAVKLNADMLEIDVRVTKDGVPVAFHDITIDRVTDGSGLIQHLTLQNARNLKVGKEVIPTVEELVSKFSNKIGFNFDVKVPEAAPELKRIIKKHQIEKKTIISTFRKSVIIEFEDFERDSIKTGILCWYASSRTLNFAIKYGVDFIHPYHMLLTREKVQNIKNLGLGINPWTVDSKWALRRMSKFEISGIITNRPKIAKKIVK